MKVSEQGARGGRYRVIPRTLIFLTRVGAGGEREVLLLRGAATKRLWANRYNGIGGHVEAGEDILAAATRELTEEAGLRGVALHLRGLVTVDTRSDDAPDSPGICIFVMTGEATDQAVTSTAEGLPEWIPLSWLPTLPVVDDLPELVTRVLDSASIFYGHYTPQPDGSLRMDFR
jgi:8-oxo-dGTP diphosphatase